MFGNRASCRKFVFTLSTVLLAGAASLASHRADAQVRPAYTKNVDEPGRLPYEYDVQFNRNGCLNNCSNFVAINSKVYQFDAPPVPNGKRLILQWVSANLPNEDNLASIAIYDVLSISLSTQSLKWSYAGPFYSASIVGDDLGMSSGIFATFGPGDVPRLKLNLDKVSNLIFASVTLTGYLIDATN